MKANLNIELVAEVYAEKPTKFADERSTYDFIKRKLSIEVMKIYAMTNRGFPDFIITDSNFAPVKPGFAEVKFLGRKLRPAQEAVLRRLAKNFNVYLINLENNKDGRGCIEVYKVLC